MAMIVCHIKRFDGNNEWIQTYEVPYESGKTIVWLLAKIREEQDITLNFTVSCLHAVCGACGLNINGSSYLACHTSLDDVINTFHTHELTFEPLLNFTVIRDLVIDWEEKINKLKQVTPWLIPHESGNIEQGFKQSAKQFEAIESSIDCMLCGICSSVCEQLAINDDFLDPFMFTKAYRMSADTRDKAATKRLAATMKGDLAKCVRCMKCTSFCPKNIDIATEISYLRSGKNCLKKE